MSLNDLKHVIITDLREEFVPSIVKIGAESGLSFWSEESYLNNLNKSIGLTAVLKEEVIGFILIRFASYDEAEVLNFAVRQNFRNRGIGKFLFEEAVRRTNAKNNIKYIWLEVRETNSSAIRFYQKFGFTAVGKRKNFYSFPTEDALLMKFEYAQN